MKSRANEEIPSIYATIKIHSGYFCILHMHHQICIMQMAESTATKLMSQLSKQIEMTDFILLIKMLVLMTALQSKNYVFFFNELHYLQLKNGNKFNK